MKTRFSLPGSLNLVSSKLLIAVTIGIALGAAGAKAVPSSSSASSAENSKANIAITTIKDEGKLDPSFAEMKEQMQRLEDEIKELRSAVPFGNMLRRTNPWWEMSGANLESFFPTMDLMQSAFEHSWHTNSFPRINAREEGDQVEVSAEVPGMDQKDLELTITDHSVILKGKREFKEDKNENESKHKRGFESFTQSIQLPAKIQTDKAVAALEKGILKITAQKKNDKETDERKLSIKTE